MTSLFIRITELLIFCLPFVTVLAVLGVVTALMVWLFRAHGRTPLLKVCIRAAGTVLVLPLTLALMFLLLMGACTSRPRIIVSPDFQHVARYEYQVGFLSRDTTFVFVRKKWSIRSEQVYEYIGPSDWKDTDVRWLDNHRLMIRYHPNQAGGHQECKTEGAGIDVLCVTAVY
ncbi:MAG: hypothetical protein LAO24_14570 [Acidobacteriia bacterium]|nr:hypothetical protein [Terriglobia bacterium]